VVGGLAAATVHWFIWPPQQAAPAHVDAIVMLSGPGDGLDTALDLTRGALGSHDLDPAWLAVLGHGSVCAARIPGGQGDLL
jgi:hypothetical protein